MYRIDSVPVTSMYPQPDRQGNQHHKTAIDESNGTGSSFQKCFESYLQEATSSAPKEETASQVADILNWQYMLVLPLRSKIKLAVGDE